MDLKNRSGMKLINQIEKLQKLNKLISEEKTGTPEEFAEYLNISKSKLYELLDDLKSFGAEVKYSRKEKTFYYTDSSKLEVKFSLKLIRKEEIINIRGGSKFLLPYFFMDGTPLYLS